MTNSQTGRKKERKKERKKYDENAKQRTLIDLNNLTTHKRKKERKKGQKDRQVEGG